MKNTKRILIASVIAALILSFVSVFAFAGEDPTSPESESAVSTDREASTPHIATKNIRYSSYLYMLVAIPESEVPKEAELSLIVRHKDSTEGEYVISDSRLQTITIGGSSAEYYVFETHGIRAANVAETVVMTPTLTYPDGTEVAGRSTSYSVAEYCYERLIRDGFANKVITDGRDFNRTELYCALLEYGNAAYKVVGSSSTASPEDFGYVSLKNTTSDTFGVITEDKTLKIEYDPSIFSEDYIFGGWAVYKVSTSGQITYSYHSSNSITVTAARGGTLVYPIINKSDNIIFLEKVAEAEKQDAINKANQWVSLRGAFITKLGYSEENTDLIISELENLYTLYGREMVTWVANLYAKGYYDGENEIWAGGFYASSAGKDVYGYGPDLQSTVQLLRFLQQSGVISSVSGDIPKWMQHELVYFAKSLQHENGFFYHPQWGKEYTDQRISRRGRDLGWGTSLLDFFGAKPQYDTPSGKTGDGIDADEYLALKGVEKPLFDSSAILTSYEEYEYCSCGCGLITPASQSRVILTSALGSDAESAVSRVILAASESSSTGTEYMSTHTAFINYLLTTIEPGMKTGAYSTGNTLNATNGQISNFSKLLGAYSYQAGDEANTAGATAADYKRFDGMTLNEMVLDVLDSTVNPLIGLFGSWTETNGWTTNLSFANSNGFFKVISIYNGQKHAYPYPAEAAISLIDNLTNPDLPSTGNACDVYNVWNAISSLKSNVSSSQTIYAVITDASITPAKEGDEGAVPMTVKQFINKALEIRGADAVRVTFEKIKGYKKVDGGFSHSYVRGATSHQGCPIAPANNVSDVDGTCIASTGLVRSLFEAFALGSYRPAFFGEADYLIFINTLENMRPTRKASDSKMTEEFEDTTLKNDIKGDFEIEGGRLLTNGSITVSRSPLSTVGENVTLRMSLSLSERATITVLSDSGELDRLILEPNGDYITVTRQSTGSYATVSQEAGSVNLSFVYTSSDQGFNFLLLENGTCIMEEALFSSENDVYNLDAFTLSADGTVIIDDMLFAMTSPAYTNKNSDGRIDFSSIPEGEFDHAVFEGTITFTNQTDGGENGSEALIVTEGTNKFLRLDDNWSSGSSTQNYFDFKTDAAPRETLVFEAKMRIARESGGAVPITLRGSSACYYGALNISGGYLCAGVCTEKSKVGSCAVKTDVKANEWFTLRIEYTADLEYSEDTFRAAIYVNDKLIMESNAEADTLDYHSAESVTCVRMACDTSWLGTIDYDDIYLGSKQDYTPIKPTDAHQHFTQSYTEDLTKPTCSKGGSYTAVIRCTGPACGLTISKVYVKTPPACTRGELVEEDRIPASCYVNGEYYLVGYCTECGEECYRERVVIPAAHKEATREENRIEPSCTEAGKYTLVTYCSACGDIISKESFTLPLDYHNVVDGVCTVCGGSNFKVYGIEDFESIEAQSYIVSNTRHNFDKTESGWFVSIYAPSGHVNAAVVDEGENKYLTFEKIRNDTNSNTWIDFIREDIVLSDQVVFETRLKYDITTLGSGIYARFYSGRTTSGGGTRLTNHTISKNGKYVVYQGVQTHAELGKWFTMRATVTNTASGHLFTLFIKNETASSITFNGKTYAVGEYVPYFTSSLLVEIGSMNEINAFTLMQSTNSLTKISVDDAYIGGKETYTSRPR